MSEYTGTAIEQKGLWAEQQETRNRLAEERRRNADKERGDILWYALDDLVAGRLSALADAETVLKLLQRDRPVPLNMGAIKHAFRSLDPAGQRALIDILTNEMERPRP